MRASNVIFLTFVLVVSYNWWNLENLFENKFPLVNNFNDGFRKEFNWTKNTGFSKVGEIARRPINLSG